MVGSLEFDSLRYEGGADPLLQLRGVSKTFGSQRVLDRVDLSIGRHQVHGLVGQNGSGKSTLVKLLAGYHQPDPGSSAMLNGNEIRLGVPSEQIRFVHQDLALVDSLSVSENFWICGGPRRLRPLKRSVERSEVSKALTDLGYQISPKEHVGALSAAEKTAVAVARALYRSDDVQLLVLDEATAALPGAEVDRLCAALRRVVSKGTSVLFISHHIDEVLSFADEVTVLRDGHLVCTVPTDALSHDSLVERMLGSELQISGRLDMLEDTSRSRPARLAVHGLVGRTVRAISFDVGEGEIVGIAGVTGSGREEIAGLLAGATDRRGDVRVNGQLLIGSDPIAAIKSGIAYIPANRHRDAVLPQRSLRENLTLGDLSPFWRRGVFHHAQERKETRRWIELLGIVPPNTEQSIDEFSGGNQQKIIIARWLRVDAAVYVLDEPTQGVDVGAKADIHRLLHTAADRGAGVVICSTDADELAHLASRVIVMHRGIIGAELHSDLITAERIEQVQLLATTSSAAPEWH